MALTRNICCRFAMALLLTLPLAAEITPREEREIALWIIRLGGSVMVDGIDHRITDPFDLPDRDFRIVVVDMHGTITAPKDLDPLSKLTQVPDLYIPPRAWNPI